MLFYSLKNNLAGLSKHLSKSGDNPLFIIHYSLRITMTGEDRLTHIPLTLNLLKRRCIKS